MKSFSDSDAQRLLRVIDGQIDKRLADRIPQEHWGIVTAVDVNSHTCSVLLYGQTANASQGFLYSDTVVPVVGDAVRVTIDPRGDRFVSLVPRGGIDSDIGWQAPTLLNSWANYGSPMQNAGYRRNSSGIVVLRGTVKNGSPVNSTVFTLPAGYRPLATCILPAVANGSFAQVRVQSNGNVNFESGGSATSSSLDGVTFMSEVSGITNPTGTVASTFGWSDSISGSFTGAGGSVPNIDAGLGTTFRKVWCDPERSNTISPFVVATYMDDHIGQPGQYMTVYNRFSNGAQRYSIHDGYLDMTVQSLGGNLWNAILLATSVGGSATQYTFGFGIYNFWLRYNFIQYGWQAAWLYDTTNWSSTEIDYPEILENPRLHAGVIGSGSGSATITNPSDIATVFHKFTIERRSGYCAFSLDDVEKARITKTQESKNLAIMLDTCVGWPWGYTPTGTPMPWLHVAAVTVDP